MSRKSDTETAKKLRKTSSRVGSNVIHFPKARAAVPLAHRMNMREMCSIKAMTAYVAHNQNVQEETVRAFVEAEFHVGDIQNLRRDDFERVIAYLVELRCDLLMN